MVDHRDQPYIYFVLYRISKIDDCNPIVYPGSHKFHQIVPARRQSVVIITRDRVIKGYKTSNSKAVHPVGESDMVKEEMDR